MPGGFARDAVAGKDTLHFTGRLGRSALAPGAYVLVARGTDAAGRASNQQRAGFAVIR